ncbi:MAG: molybdenum cofactor biosynthesis protein MoaE [Pseudomonadota bacterium]
MRVVVQEDPFDLGEETTRFATAQSASGAVVTFSGIVRDVSAGLKAMHIEHYPGMTERALTEIARTAIDRWSLEDALVIHRYGTLKPGEQIMMVATAARHRKDAFEAAEYLMDYLKSRAPFWKREQSGSGEEWVASRAEDEAALNRW